MNLNEVAVRTYSDAVMFYCMNRLKMLVEGKLDKIYSLSFSNHSIRFSKQKYCIKTVLLLPFLPLLR